MPFDHAAVAHQIAAGLGAARDLAHLRRTGAEAAAALYRATPHDTWCERVRLVLHGEKTKRWIAEPLTPLHNFPTQAALDIPIPSWRPTRRSFPR